MLRRRFPNPVKRAIDRKVSIPLDWIAWHVPLPERVFDRILAWNYGHAGAGAKPTKREWRQINEQMRQLPLTPRSRFEPPC